MPSHWGHKRAEHRLAVEPDRHAVPAGDRLRRSRPALREGHRHRRARGSTSSTDEVIYVSIGEGTTSEGEFWESLNSACIGKLPVVYMIEDNGYAISVPVEVQTAGGDISKLVASFPGLFVQSIDGTDFLGSYRRAGDAVAYARARKGPALVHAQGRPAVLPLAVGRREAVQDAGRARSGSDARSDRPDGRVPEEPKGSRPRTSSKRSSKEVEREVNEAADTRDEGRQAGTGHGHAVRLLPGRRSVIRRLRDRGRSPKASRTRWSRRSTAR